MKRKTMRAQKLKKMGSISEWLKRNWPVFAIIAIAVGSVFFFHWVLTRPLPLPPYP